MRPDSEPFEIEDAHEAPPEGKQHGVDRDNALLGIRAELCYCLGIILVLAVLALMLIATLLRDWSYVLVNGHDRGYALFQCDHCEDGVDGGSWSCLRHESCTSDKNSGLCNTAKDMHNAGACFLALELFGMLTTILLIERLIFLIFKRSYGWSGSVYCIAAAMFTLQVAAVGAWFGVSGAEFSANCTDQPEISTDLWPVCAESAPAIAVANLVAAAIVGIFICVIISARPKKADPLPEDENTGYSSFVCWENHYVMLALFLFLFTHLTLFIASLAVQDWATINGHTGSLFNIDRWAQINTYGYDCISARNCIGNNDTGACKTFTDLTEAGWGYTGLEIAALFFYVLWMEPTFYLTIGKEFGFPVLNYTWGIFSFVAHFTATVMWFRVSEATYETTCSNIPTNVNGKWNICATSGPSIALANLVLFAFTFPLWAAIYYSRKSGLIEKAKKSLQSEEDES